jgi:DNA-binding SARP family transcriptional activator
MARLSIHLFGPFHALVDDCPVWGFKTDKDRLLLAYLAVEKAQPNRREALAELLWPGRPQGAALANLRHTLSILRKILQTPHEDPPFLVATRHCLQLNPAADIWTDIEQFQFLLNQNLPPSFSADRLERAVCCYSGAFLEGFLTCGILELEGWIEARRAQYHQMFMLVLNRLSCFWEGQKEYGKALSFAYRTAELEPWSERANYNIIRLLTLDEQHNAAITHFEAYRRTLKNELGTEPALKTNKLYKQILTRNTVWSESKKTPNSYWMAPNMVFLSGERNEVKGPIYLARPLIIVKQPCG